MGRSVGVVLTLFASIALTGIAVAQDSCPKTTPQENADLVRRFNMTVYMGHNPKALPDFYAEDFNRTNAARPQKNEPGLDDDIARVERSLREFPDLGGNIEEEIAVDDRVVVVMNHAGTQRGALQGWGTPATNRHATWKAIQVMRIACGKIIESIVVDDRFSMFRQLGVISDEELKTVE